MFSEFTNDYAAWREKSPWRIALRENSDAPPENLLQAVWFHQRLRRDELQSIEGRRLRVLHPGFWNREPGPDFREAVIQFDGEDSKRGDVEIDLKSSDWRSHQHDSNPAYAAVVLHVVWRHAGRATGPTLELAPVLDATIEELGRWHGSDSARAYPEALIGRCCAPLRDLSETQLDELLRQAASIRLQSKAAQFQARARQAGWEQSLWEGIFRGFGYKRNQWPMQRLGELRAELLAGDKPPSVRVLQGRLLGVAGLLPPELSGARGRSDEYLRQLWDGWWRDRERFGVELLPRSLWDLSGIRPANHPQRRLALIAHWLADGRLCARLEAWCVEPVKEGRELVSLLAALLKPEDDFWGRHWTLRSKPAAEATPLLGATRVTDLTINVVLPWLWIRAVEGRNESMRREIERRYFAWPAAEDNAVLKLARQRLFGGKKWRGSRHAAAQQGLLQVVRDFCANSNSLCADCPFPDLVKSRESQP